MKRLFFALAVRPLLALLCGVRVRGREHLPQEGPAIVVANHNSHLDTPALMSLFPLKRLPAVRPVAARDYFFTHPLRRFVAERLVGVLPIDRRPGPHAHPLDPLSRALERGETLIIFPEGTRGEPGRLQPFKSGFARLAARHPHIPVIPVKISGTDRALPKEEALWVPFLIDIEIMAPVRYGQCDNMVDFKNRIERLYHAHR